MPLSQPPLPRPKDGTWVFVMEFPACDFCSEAAHYDARTIRGQWANMCDLHWHVNTHMQLGTGFGQELILITESRAKK